jgi:hypothetical protein
MGNTSTEAVIAKEREPEEEEEQHIGKPVENEEVMAQEGDMQKGESAN